MSRPLLTREASRDVDRLVIEAGVPGLILMENAGRGAAELLLDRMGGRLERPVIVGGTGQNGGDAWVIGRRLIREGLAPRAFLAGAREAVGGDAAVNLGAFEAVGGEIEVIGESREPLTEALAGATVIVDGIFGTGLDRPIEGWRRGLVEELGAAAAPVFALDLPSGIDADTGAVLGVALTAEVTATFAAEKRGLWQGEGRRCAGEIVPVDIGVPTPSSDDVVLELADAARWMPPRAYDTHKGRAGHVLVLAGNAGKTGAALLSGHGALRGGAGLVTIAASEAGQRVLDPRVVELMTARLGDEDPAADALALAEGKKAVVLGPGFGLEPARRELAVRLARELPTVAVLDADALTALADELDALEGTPPRVLTPHPGEAARLLGTGVGEVQADRYAAATELAARTGHVVVLKGAGTIVAEPGRLAVCPLGSPALGVAGTGDVLSGAVAAAVHDGAGLFETSCAAVLLHARSGERGAVTDRGLLAREVADGLPDALAEARLTR